MTNVQTIPAIYVKLPNRPGALEHATRVLGEHKINIDNISVETIGSTGYARILTPKSHEALAILQAANIDAHETELVTAQIANKPGELSRVCAELAAAGVNIEAMLTSPSDGRVTFRTNDNALAARVISKFGSINRVVVAEKVLAKAV
jgi:hypothetical protein